MSQAYAVSISHAPSPFATARAFVEETEQLLTNPAMMSAAHSEAEDFVNARGREWARLALEAQFALRAEREKRVGVVGADGVTRGGARESERHIETIVGRVAAPRLAYQAPGCVDLHPMDGLLNLPTRDSFSHGVRRMVHDVSVFRRQHPRCGVPSE
jgi:hypothetical protein